MHERANVDGYPPPPPFLLYPFLFANVLRQLYNQVKKNRIEFIVSSQLASWVNEALMLELQRIIVMLAVVVVETETKLSSSLLAWLAYTIYIFFRRIGNSMKDGKNLYTTAINLWHDKKRNMTSWLLNSLLLDLLDKYVNQYNLLFIILKAVVLV